MTAGTRRLNPALADTLRVIGDFTARHGYPPTYASICWPFGITKSSAKRRVDQLCELGLLTYQRKKWATITLTEAGKAAIK